MQPSTIVLESQPDWLTVTVHGGKATRSVAAKVETLMRSERVGGNRQLPFRVGEYIGTRCGRVRAGEVSDRLIVQLSGDLAAQHADWFLSHAHAVTRLDLAVTVQTLIYSPDIAHDAYLAAYTYRTDHPRSAVPSLVINGAGGSTCYLGKRTGDKYFRAYDKEQECRASDDADATARYQRAWRFELELHDDAAAAVAFALPKGQTRHGWISSYVYGYLCDHGITPIWSPGVEPVHVGGFRRRTDRESRLDWLSRSVAPTVRWLIDSTPRDILLKRLGLDEAEGVE